LPQKSSLKQALFKNTQALAVLLSEEELNQLKLRNGKALTGGMRQDG
jgi:hypothetical protein